MGENRRESTAAAGAVNAQDDKLERGRERPPGEERRCSDLHHPSLQPSLLRAGCFLPHGSDFPPVCFILGGENSALAYCTTSSFPPHHHSGAAAAFVLLYF